MEPTAKPHANTAKDLRTTLASELSKAATVYADLDLVGDPRGDLHSSAAEERYEARTTLGEGGMGEVLLCRDRCIGREVAMKIVHRQRNAGADLHARFLREARVQGQLEHPAIVPVYDLAKDASGRCFFTMKRVRGDTLELVIARLAFGHERSVAQYTLHKLLAAYTRVCLAVDFAHASGVVHRDLKPSNVMLGDFGEVYVLDWGVAKVDGADDVPSVESLQESGERLIVRGADDADTVPGTILGTPAYMAPEQLRGQPADVRTDVYALGAILFEILTLTSLHVADEELRAEACANVPPELNAIWRKATALDPSERHGSARELHDAVESFLSGDRDLASRKLLVEGHLAAARELRAIRPETLANRSAALAEVGRAIALDPNHAEALGILVELLSEPPQEPPQEVVQELERVDTESRIAGLKRGVLLYTLPVALFFMPATILMGLKSIPLAAICFASFILTGAVAWLCHRRPNITRHVPWVTVASSIAMATTAVLAGMYVLLPTFVVANTMCHAISGRRSHRGRIMALGALAILVPMVCELLGIGPASHAFVNGSLVLKSHILVLSERYTPLFLMVINLGMTIFTARYVCHFRDALTRSDLQKLSQLWQLRQLVPERVRTATSDPPPSNVT